MAVCSPKDIRITFGLIVLNGEPFTRYCLRSLYPFAHQIVVVEGATPGAACIATEDGHSTDGTLEILRSFQRDEDPQGKVRVVLAEDEGHPDGFWPGEKDEQSQVYAKRATGNYLWQVDIDEFYRAADMSAVLDMLRHNSDVAAVSFRQLAFWGGFGYTVDGWQLRHGSEIFHRLFKWKPGYQYVTHRPPTVVDETGRDLRGLKWLSGHELAARGIVLYHYSLLFPKQVLEKCEYYSQAAWATGARDASDWARSSFLKLGSPYHVQDVQGNLGWLERFSGKHPAEIDRMREELRAGRLNVEERPMEDIELLLSSPWYRMGRATLKLLERSDRALGGRLDRWEGRAARLLRNPLDTAKAVWRRLKGTP